jgi:hypothetical protein
VQQIQTGFLLIIILMLKNQRYVLMMFSSATFYVYALAATCCLYGMIVPVSGIDLLRRREQSKFPPQFTGSFTVVKADQLVNATFKSIFVGNYTSGSTIDITNFKGSKLSLFVHTTNENIKILFDFETTRRNESTAPYALLGNDRNNYVGVDSFLYPGLKTITATAFNDISSLETKTFMFRIIDSSIAAPPVATTSKPSLKPVSMPVTRPVQPPLTPPVQSSPKSLFTGTFAIVKADQLPNATFQSIFIGNYTSGSTIDVQKYSSNIVSLILHTTSENFKITFDFEGIHRDESTPPFALLGNENNNYVGAVSFSTPGLKTFTATASNSVSILETKTFQLNVIDSSLFVNPPVQPSPGVTPTPANYLLSNTWKVTETNAPLIARHEACFVMVGRRAVLLGGRGTRRPNIFNPITKTWTVGAETPSNIELNHMQCVAVKNKVWLMAAWTGGFPQERNVDVVYVYDPFMDKWESKTALADPRRRGSSAVVAVGELIYVAFGNRGGHETADHAVSLPYLDVYNTTSDTWKALPDASYGRDHTGGALVNGRICVGGGRDGGLVGWPTVAPTECFDIATNKWTIEANILQPRAGASYGTSCDGKLLIAGGEGLNKAYKNVEMFDGSKWTRLADLNIARHGTGLAVDCVCNAIYIASGNGQAGGGMEMYSVETISLNDQPCLA